MEMDFKSMKRKELQALCKKNGLPANSTNSQMAESLASLFQIQEKMKPKGCLKGSGGSSGEYVEIGRGGSKKVTFMLPEEEQVESEEFPRNPDGKSRRRSIRRSSFIPPEPEKRSEEIEKGGGLESSKNDSEIPVRTTRSRALSMGVLWSPVVEKKKKKARNGTEDVCQNAEPTSDKEEDDIKKAVKESYGEAPTTRSLRNRVVVVGEDEGLPGDSKPRRTQKRRNTHKVEEDILVAPLLNEASKNQKLRKDEFFGRKDLQKRPRGGDSGEDDSADQEREMVIVCDEPPRRRSSRNLEMLEELGATEAFHVVRSKKSRKGAVDVSVIEPKIVRGVDEEIERVSKPGNTAKRSRDSLLNSNGTVSGDVNEASGWKKPQKQVKNRALKQGDSTTSLPDCEVVTEPIRRSTCSSSNDETSLPVAGKLADDDEAVRKEKLGKQAKIRASKRGNSTVSLPGREAVTEPTRRSTRNSSNLLENETSLLVVGKLGDDDEAVRKDKSGKQAKNRASKQGDSTVSLPDREAVTEPTKRATRSSSNLLEDETSLPVVGKLGDDDEAVRKDKSGKQAKNRASKRGDSTVSLPGREAVTEPTRRSTRSSSNLLEDGTSLPVVGKLGDDDEVRKDNSGKQAKNRASKPGGSTMSLPGREAIFEPTRRSTRTSSNLLEDETSLSLVGKVVDDDEAVRKDRSGKQASNRASRRGGSAALFPDSETVTEATRRLTQSSSVSNLVENETSLPVCGQLGDDDEAARKDKPGKQARSLRSRRGAAESCIPSCEAERLSGEHEVQEESQKATQPEEVPRRSRRNALKCSESKQEILLPEGGNLGDEAEFVKKKKSQKRHREQDSHGQGSEASVSDFKTVAESEASEVHDQLEEPLRRSRRNASKHDESHTAAVLLTASDEVVESKQGRKRTRAAALGEDISVVEGKIAGGFGGMGTRQEHFNNARRKSLRKIPADNEVMQREFSPDPTLSLLEDIPKDSDVKGKGGSGRKTSNKKQSSQMHGRKGDRKITISRHHKKEDQNILTGEAATSESHELMDISDNLDSFPGPSSAALSVDSSIAMESGGALTVISNDAENKNISEVHLSSLVVQLQESENGISLEGSRQDGLDDVRLGSLFKQKQSGYLEMANEGKEASVSNFVEGSSEFKEDFLGGLGYLNVEGGLEVEGTIGAASEGKSDVDDKDSILMLVVSTASTIKANSSGTFVGTLDSEDDGMEGNEATNITGPPLPCKSSEKLSLTSDTETYPEIGLGEPDTKPKVHDASEDGMEGSEATIISGPPLPFRSIEELSQTAVTEASPETDLEETDSKAEVHDASGMISHSDDFPIHTSDNHNKTVELSSMVVDADCGDFLSLQRVFRNEIRSCGEDLETISDAQLAPEECDVAEEFKETPTKDSGTQLSEAVLEEVKENLASSSLYVEENDGVETGGKKNDNEKTEAGVRRSSPSWVPASSLCSDDQVRESEIQLSSEEIMEDAGSLGSYGSATHDGIETGKVKNYYERTEAEVRQSSASESPAFGLCTGDQVKDHGIQLSSEILEDAMRLSSHGSAKQFDVTHMPVQGRVECLYAKDPVDVEGNSRDSDEGNKDPIQSPIDCIKSKEPTNVTAMAIKDNEVSPYKLAEASREITEGKSDINKKGAIQSGAGCDKSAKETDKQEPRFLFVDVQSPAYSIWGGGGGDLVDVGLFGDDKRGFKAKNICGISSSSTCAEEVMPRTDRDASVWIDFEDLTEQANVHDFVDSPAKTVELLATSADTDSEYCPILHGESRNERDSSETALDTMLNGKSAPWEFDVVSELNLNSAEGCDSQACDASVEECKESFTFSYILDDTEEAGAGGSKGESNEENIIAETRCSLVSESPAFDLCADDKVQERGIEIQSEETLEFGLDALVSSTFSNQQHFKTAKGGEFSLSKIVKSACLNIRTVSKEPDSEDANIPVEAAEGSSRATLADKFHEADLDSVPSPVDCNKHKDQEEIQDVSCQVMDVESSASTIVASEIIRDHTGAFCDNLCTEKNLNDVVKGMIATDEISLHRTAEATPPIYYGQPDIPLETPGVRKMAIGVDASPPVPTTGCLDSEAGSHFSFQQRESINQIASYGVVSVDTSPSSAPKEYAVAEKLNVVTDVLTETANAADKFLNVEFERSCGPGDEYAEVETMESLEGGASSESEVGSVGKKEDSALVDQSHEEVVPELDVALVLQGIHDMNEKLQTAGIAANSPLKTLGLQVSSLSDMDAILSDEKHMEKENAEKVCAEEEPTNCEEFPPLAEKREGQGSATCKEELFSVEGLDSAESPSTEPDDLSPKLDAELDDEKEVEGGMELHFNVHEEVEEQEDTLTVLGESKMEDREEASPIRPKSPSETIVNVEKCPSLSAAGSSYFIPIDDFKCKEAGIEENSSFQGINLVHENEEDYDPKEDYIIALAESRSEDADYADDYNDIEREETSLYWTSMISTTKIAEAELDVDFSNNMSTSKMVQDAAATEVHENEKASPTTRQPLISLHDQISSKIKEDSATVSADQVDETPVVRENMSVLLGQLGYETREDDAIGYGDASKAKFDCWDFEETAAGENEDCMVAAIVGNNSSSKARTPDEEKESSNECEGKFDSFEQAPVVPRSEESDIDEAWVAQGALLFLEDFCHVDSQVAIVVNDSTQVAQCEDRLGEENLGCVEGENFAEINVTQEAGGEKEGMKPIVLSRSSDPESVRASPFEYEMTYEAKNISGSSPKPFDGLECQASIPVHEEKSLDQETNAIDKDEETHSATRCDDQDEGRESVQETPVVSKSRKDEEECNLDGTKIDGAVAMEAKSEEVSITLIPAVAKQADLVSGNCMENSVTQVADQAASGEFDCKESSVMEKKPCASNAVEHSESREALVTDQQTLFSVDAEAFNVSSTTILEEHKFSKGEIVAHDKKFKDIGRYCCSETANVDSSLHKGQEVDSEFPMEPTLGNSNDSSLKSGISANCEQNKSSEVYQMEDISRMLINFRISSAKKDSKAGVQSTPAKLIGSFKPHSAIDGIKDKENTPGLKMDSSWKHNGEKSAMGNSARRPLQSVRRSKAEH